MARAAGIPIVADFEDASSPQFNEVLNSVDHLVLSTGFSRQITGMSTPEEAALALWRKDRTTVIVTCGAQGCWSVSAENPTRALHHPAFSVTTSDTTGCGDVFHGAYAARLAAGDDLNHRIRFAMAAAALKASETEIPSLDAVDRFLASQPKASVKTVLIQHRILYYTEFMKLLPMQILLQAALKGGYAVPSFCAWNAEVTETILRVAARMKSPVILMSGPGEFSLNSPDTLACISEALVAKYRVPAALHLDHGDSLELVEACLSAGYTSVMLDYSTRLFDENVAALQAVSRRAHALGVTVEGEIGCVGRADDLTSEGGKTSSLTDPADAARYAELTQVDALAVSIGNAHGLYTKLPVFDFDRLEKIRKLVAVPLVLHGGSGTQPEYLRKAIGLGMAKINVASELCKAFRDGYAQAHSAGASAWLPTALGGILPRIAEVVKKWIELCGCEGRAN
jgi:tagatose 1,6-diphosphate aldolase GatY/KbaY